MFMKNFNKTDITCRHCGKTFTRKQFSLIDRATDASEAGKVIKGTVFNETCPYCKHIDSYPYSFLYRQRQYYTAYACNKEDYDTFVSEASDYEGEVYRVTDDLVSLAEKALIFSMNLDDRIIEVLKVIYRKMFEKVLKGYKDIVFNYGQNEDGEYYMLFLPYNSLKDIKNHPMKITDNLYRVMCCEYEDYLETYTGETVTVDADWADQFMSYVQSEMDRESADAVEE